MTFVGPVALAGLLSLSGCVINGAPYSSNYAHVGVTDVHGLGEATMVSPFNDYTVTCTEANPGCKPSHPAL